MKFSKSLPNNSDHFKTDKFVNPGVESRDKKSLLKFLKVRMTHDWAKWPDKVEVTQLKPENRITKGIKVSFVNHSTFLIQTEGLNFLTDPVWSKRVSPFKFAGPKRVHEPGIRFEDLPPIDFVLISHNHYDHMDIETLQKLEKAFAPLFLVGLGNELFLKEKGLTNIVEMDWWETHTFKNFTLHFVPAQHFSGRWLDDGNKTLWGGFVVQTSSNKKIYFAGDSGYGFFMKDISKKLGAMDLSLIPIGAYEPRFFMKTMHMNPEEAVLSHLDLKSKQSVGIHFGCFQLTAEEIDAPQKEIKKSLQAHNIDADKFISPEPGKAYEF